MGQCCPSCNACPRNVHDGDEIAHYSNDTCIRCYCFKGQVICHRRICPVLPCPVSKQIRSKNSCCPRCSISSQDEIRSNSFAKNSCVFGEKIYHHLEQFKADDCTKCECKVDKIRDVLSKSFASQLLIFSHFFFRTPPIIVNEKYVPHYLVHLQNGSRREENAVLDVNHLV